MSQENKKEIGANLMIALNTFIVCLLIAIIVFLVTDYNKTAFEEGYIQTVKEGRLVWVKDESLSE